MQEKLRLMGTAEIQDRLGVGRARAYQIVSRRGFPEPYVVLKMGQIWLADDVEAWMKVHRPELAEDPEGE
jgi:prophage regulatory protein